MLFTKNSSSGTWMRIALFNLLLVGLFGLVMRLKMVLPMPWINQKFLLHAHSHFAFTGWVSHALMVLILAILTGQLTRNQGHLSDHQSLPRQARILILANLLTAYGMLVTFTIQGYALYSITFSTISIVVSYFFSVYVWNVIKSSHYMSIDPQVSRWFRAALILLVFSSLGTFALSYLMATHNIDSRKQLAAVYFYLHFQYNGWFLFACLGLFHHWLSRHGIQLKRAGLLYRVFAVAVIPTYFLSVLWWKAMPDWLYILVVVVTVAQLMAWLFWFVEIMSKASQLKAFSTLMVRFTLLVAGLAYGVKVLLQALSLIPDLSQLAYGYRPIVIGYLHLILLVVISLFILAYAFANRYLKENLIVRTGIYTAIAGILFNEALLMIQGLSGMLRIYVDHTHQLLVVASVTICLGLLIALSGQIRKSPDTAGR